MRLPHMVNTESTSKRQIVEFKGINYSPVIEEGEFSDTQNLSTDEYPCLAPRKPRTAVKKDLNSPTALYGKRQLCYVDGTEFFYNGVAKGIVTPGKKQFVSIGDKIIIFPDKTYYDISDDVYGPLDKKYVSAANQITFTATTITTTGANFDFRVGDAVTISGCTVAGANNTTAIIKSVAAKVLTFNAGTFTASTETAAITIERAVPDMDYVMENNNRIWGCKGSMIYGSKLGDPFNYNVFAGISSDSYSVPVGSDGDFTGCAGYATHLVFFKENFIHRIYGSRPSNYQMTTSQCHGLQAGCEKSIVTIDDLLIFKSRVGIMCYQGDIPELISHQLGSTLFTGAVAGTDGKKYYVSLKKGTVWTLYCYDVQKYIWLKEDNTQILDFAFLDGVLYFLGADKVIYKTNDEESKESIHWIGTFGELNEMVDGKKHYLKFNLHVELHPGSLVTVSVNCDRTGWREVAKLGCDTRKTVSIPIIPARCDILNLRIEGMGYSKIYSLTKVVQVGSEV